MDYVFVAVLVLAVLTDKATRRIYRRRGRTDAQLRRWSKCHGAVFVPIFAAAGYAELHDGVPGWARALFGAVLVLSLGAGGYYLFLLPNSPRLLRRRHTSMR